MSALNGDKARFQRRRKAGIVRRERSKAVQVAVRLEGARTVEVSSESDSATDVEREGGRRLIRGGVTS